MMTWMLFIHGFWGWGAPGNAIFMRGTRQEPVWQGAVRRLARFRAVWLLLGLVWAIVGIRYVHNALFAFIPPLVVFTFALALALGPAVVEERTKARWELLLTVPYDMNTILLGKASGALWHIRFLTYAIGILLMCASAVVGTTSLALIPVNTAQLSNWQHVGLWGAFLIAPVLGGLIFIFDRMQYYALLAVAALASGASAHSVRGALLTAVAVVLLIWLVETAAAETLLTLAQGEGWRLTLSSVLPIVTLGPIASYLFEMELSCAALCILGTLIVRELLIVSLWRWAVYSAQQTGKPGPAQ